MDFEQPICSIKSNLSKEVAANPGSYFNFFISCWNYIHHDYTVRRFSSFNLQGYYKRTPAYMPIRKQERRGCFDVPMVHSTYLVDLRKEASRQLAFYPPHPEYNWALDDVIVLPTQLAWRVRRVRERYLEGLLSNVFLEMPSCVCVSIVCLSSLLSQMCRCMCATKKRMGTSRCRCAPWRPCRTRRRASCTRSSRSWVSQDVKGPEWHTRLWLNLITD